MFQSHITVEHEKLLSVNDQQSNQTNQFKFKISTAYLTIIFKLQIIITIIYLFIHCLESLQYYHIDDKTIQLLNIQNIILFAKFDFMYQIYKN